MGQTNFRDSNNEYFGAESDMHQRRRIDMLARYPAVRQLVGPAPSTAGWIAVVLIFQIGMAALVAGLPWWLVVVSAYCIGAIASLALWTLLHECTHDLVMRTARGNRRLGLIASLPLVIPVAAAFRRYHLMHHRYLGDGILDGDIASHWECRLVGNRMVRKSLWLLAAPVMQALRPMRMKGVKLLDREAAINLVVQLLFDGAVVALLGWGGLIYLLLSNIFALGLHPLGARWIQEHFSMREGQETYSYYGPLNRLAFNAGMHVEHHDMPRVAWNKLPELRRLAPEFYDGLYAHRSWTALLVRFLTDPKIALDSRTIRHGERP